MPKMMLKRSSEEHIVRFISLMLERSLPQYIVLPMSDGLAQFRPDCLVII